MTLYIIGFVCLVIGVVLFKLGDNAERDLPLAIGFLVIGIAAVIIIYNAVTYTGAKKNSQIKYEQLLVEKATIEDILEIDKTIDRLALNEKVIEYNKKVTEYRTNPYRPIIGEYYDQSLPWNELEYIKWK